MNHDLKDRSCQDRIRPGVIVIVAAAILAAIAIPFAVIRAIWSETKPASSIPAGKLTDHASNDECVIRLDEVRRFKITASNGALRLDLITADPAKRQSVEIGQDCVLCRSYDGQKPVKWRSVRLTSDGMTTCQGRDGKLTVTIDGSASGFQAIGDQIYIQKDGTDDGTVFSAHAIEYCFPQTTPQGEAGFPQTRPAAPRRQQPIYWQARRLPN